MSTAVATTRGSATKAPTLFAEFHDETRYNILKPADTVLQDNPLRTLFATVLRFKKDEDTFPIDGGKKLSLNSRALSRIAAAAGISFINVVRVDDGGNPNYAEVSVLAEMQRLDGSIIRTTGTKQVDVNAYISQQIASQRAKPEKWRKADSVILADAERDRAQLQKFRAERAETGAKSRAIKQLLGMKSAYSEEELAKPFVIPQLTLNMEYILSTPEGKSMAIAAALGASGQMYGAPVQGFGQQPAALQAGTTNLLEAHDDDDEDAVSPAPIEMPGEDADDLPDLGILDDEPVDELADMKATLCRLWDEREHGKKESVREKILEMSLEDITRYVDWLAGMPVKQSASAPSVHGDPTCPKCDGPMWDNRQSKKNVKAPDYKCKDKACDGVLWPGQWPPKEVQA